MAAHFYRVAQPLPAAGNEFIVGFLEAFRGGDHAVFQFTAFLITTLVKGCNGVFTQFGHFTDNRFYHIRRGVFAIGQRFVVAFEIEDFVHQKAHIAHGGLISRHSNHPRKNGLTVRNGQRNKAGIVG